MGDRTDHDHPVDRTGVASARAATLDADRAERLTDLAGLIGEPTRARILCALHGVEELCVGDIALALDASEDTVSYALRVLRTAGLVRPRREGRMVFYALAEPDTGPVLRRSLDDLLTLAETVG